MVVVVVVVVVVMVVCYKHVLSYKKLVIRAEGVSQYHLLQSPTVLTKLIICTGHSSVYRPYSDKQEISGLCKIRIRVVTVRDVTLQQ
jgi:hypothetical protein